MLGIFVCNTSQSFCANNKGLKCDQQLPRKHTFVRICDLKVNLIKVVEIRRRLYYGAQSGSGDGAPSEPHLFMFGARALQHARMCCGCQTDSCSQDGKKHQVLFKCAFCLSLKGLVAMFKNGTSLILHILVSVYSTFCILLYMYFYNMRGFKRVMHRSGPLPKKNILSTYLQQAAVSPIVGLSYWKRIFLCVAITMVTRAQSSRPTS